AGRRSGAAQGVEHDAGRLHVEVRLGFGLLGPAAGRRVGAALPGTGPGDLGREQVLFYPGLVPRRSAGLVWWIAGGEPEPRERGQRATGQTLGDHFAAVDLDDASSATQIVEPATQTRIIGGHADGPQREQAVQ